MMGYFIVVRESSNKVTETTGGWPQSTPHYPNYLRLAMTGAGSRCAANELSPEPGRPGNDMDTNKLEKHGRWGGVAGDAQDTALKDNTEVVLPVGGRIGCKETEAHQIP